MINVKSDEKNSNYFTFIFFFNFFIHNIFPDTVLFTLPPRMTARKKEEILVDKK